MTSLDEIRRALSAHRPKLARPGDERRAAVALVLRELRGVPELLFIERAEHHGDPWSGHMALPGGRVEAHDADAREAAERETLEEVGVSLAGAARLGRLDDVSGGRASPTPMIVSAFVYHVAEPEPLVPNHEVREAFWFPLPALLDQARRVQHPVRRGSGVTYPGILVGKPGRHVVWGLTYRFLQGFFGILDGEARPAVRRASTRRR